MTDPGAPRAEIGFFSTAAVFYFLLALGGVVWLGLAHGRLTAEVFFDPETLLADLGLGVALAALLLGLWALARVRLEGLRALETKIAGLLGGMSRSEALALALISGFTEELFFRGAVQGSFGWLWASLIFAVMHAGSDRGFGWWTFFALVAGLSFGWVTETRGHLLPAMVGHIVVNAVQLVRLAEGAPATGPPGA